tara:strand:+ start:750 stop:1175 length:426 start_codon:yes stop_codon:yes gene_type:complete
MKRLLLLLLLAPIPAFSVPVTPNFQSGSMTSHTETTSKVSEVISVMEYQSGWQMTLTGNNITTDADSLLPAAATTSNTINGVVSTWTGLDATNMPNFTIKDATQAWQFTSSLTQPGLKSHTVITRTSEITSVTDTVSTFSQ